MHGLTISLKMEMESGGENGNNKLSTHHNDDVNPFRVKEWYAVARRPTRDSQSKTSASVKKGDKPDGFE